MFLGSGQGESFAYGYQDVGREQVRAAVVLDDAWIANMDSAPTISVAAYVARKRP